MLVDAPRGHTSRCAVVSRLGLAVGWEVKRLAYFRSQRTKLLFV